MPAQIQIDGKDYIIPIDIADVSLGKFLELRTLNYMHPYDVFVWAVGPIPLTDNAATEKVVANVLSIVQPVIDQIVKFMNSDQRLDVPKSITIMSLTLLLNNNLINRLPYWGAVKCKEIAKEEAAKVKDKGGDKAFDYTDRIPEILGHYLYAEITRSPYNESEAEIFSREVITQIPMREGIKLGNFFILKQKRFFLSKKNCLLMSLRMKKHKPI